MGFRVPVEVSPPGLGDPAWVAYRESAGDVAWRPEVAELFRAWWDLSEVRGGLRWSADIAKRWPCLH